MNFIQQAARKAIAWRKDALIPGFYVWFGDLSFRLGGTEAEESYLGVIHSRARIAIVLPGYHIWSTTRGSYDP